MIKSFKVIEIVLFSLLLIGGTLFSLTVKAAEPFNIQVIPDVEVKTILSDEEFKTKTKLIDFNYTDDSAVSHTVSIPKGWSENVAYKDIDANRKVSNKKVLAIIERYNSPPDEQHARSYITVEAMQLEYEISIRNWFVNYALLNGLSLQNLSVTKGKRELEALYVEIQKDETYIVRTKAFINGRRLLVARYFIPMPLYEDNKEFQAQVIRSVKLKTPSDVPIEELQTHGFLNQAYFDYPSSWHLTAHPVKTINYMKALLHRNTVEGQLEGQINARLYNKEVTLSRKEAIKKFRDNFTVKDYEVGSFIEDVDADYHQEMSYGSTQVYHLNPILKNMINYELWVSVSENEEYIFINSLITPSRNEEFYAWARNLEVFKLIVRTMRGHESHKSLYEYLE